MAGAPSTSDLRPPLVASSSAWQTIRKEAGLPELHFHDLRHFYVTYVRTTLGLAPALTEQLAGHSDERTHHHYTHATPEGEAIIRAAQARAYEEASAP